MSVYKLTNVQTNKRTNLQTEVSWDRMGVLLMGRAGCTVVGNIVAGLLANSSLFSLLLVQALAHLVVLVSQVMFCFSED